MCNSPCSPGAELEPEWAAGVWPGGQGGEVWAPWAGWDSDGGAEEVGGAGLGAGWGAGVLGACWLEPWGGWTKGAWLEWGPPWLCCWCWICWKCCWRALISAYFSCSMWKDWRSASSCWRWYSSYAERQTHRTSNCKKCWAFIDFLAVILQIQQVITHSLPLSVHDSFQFFKVSQLYLQLLHLGLHQQSNKRFDLPLFHCSQMLHTKWGRNFRGKTTWKKGKSAEKTTIIISTLAFTAAAASADAAAVARFPSPTSRSTFAFLSPSLSASLCPSSTPSFPSLSFSPSPERKKGAIFFYHN